MDKYTKVDVLADLDLLREDKRKFSVENETTKRYAYFGRRLFYIIIFKPETEDKGKVIYEIYSKLQKALPKFLKVFKLASGNIVYAYPYFMDKIEDATYSLLMEELLRLTGFLMLNMNNDDIETFLRDYVNVNVYIEEEEK